MGSYDPSHKKVEMLNTQRNTWQARPDYPFDWGYNLQKRQKNLYTFITFEKLIVLQVTHRLSTLAILFI